MPYMVTFIDGPAKGVRLTLERTPLFLRVVVGDGMDGQWDALDQLDDTPEPGELVHVYRKQPGEGTLHVDAVDPKTRRRVGRWYTTARYELHTDQPDAVAARDREKWQGWCRDQDAKKTE